MAEAHPVAARFPRPQPVLGQRAVPGPARRWPGATAKDRQEGARLADIVDQHIRWRLWRGRCSDPQSDRRHPGTARRHGERKAPTAVHRQQVAGVLRSLETYVCGQSDLIIDYAAARRWHEPISTATTESTVQWLLHRRMGANPRRSLILTAILLRFGWHIDPRETLLVVHHGARHFPA